MQKYTFLRDSRHNHRLLQPGKCAHGTFRTVCRSLHSSAFYFAAGESADWTTPQNDMLWRDGVKTLFDPCPAGWRVPQSDDGIRNVWNAFTAESGIWQGDEDTESSYGYGYSFGTGVVYGGSAWLPVCGYRSAPEGIMRTTMQNGYIRTSTAIIQNATQMSNAFGFYKKNTERPGKHNHSHGFSVRCVRE